MRIGSLFSGYGGLDMAVATVLGAEVAWHVEYDRAPSRILAHHYPEIPNYGDVTRVDFTTIEPVDVLTGGYPCQPFSHAGLRKGADDERHLWPHVLRAIREMGPRLAILENVRGHLSLGFANVLSDLADIGWSAEWVIIRASDAGACHQRARLFIVAYPSSNAGGERRGLSGVGGWSDQAEQVGLGDWGNAADASGQRHGRGQDAGMVGRLGTAPEGSGRQTSATRSESGDRGAADVADADRAPRQQHTSEMVSTGTQGSTIGHPDSLDAPSLGARDQSQSESGGGGGSGGIVWGDYAPAIESWERVIGRAAPRPTEPSGSGQPRLAPVFVEWMMGLPEGWVTDPAIGITRSEQLKALGNGVVPQQAELALSILLPRIEQYATEDVVA